jgi:transcription termination factor Rho
MRTRGRGGPSRGGQFNRGPNRHSNHHSGHYGGHRSPRSSEAPVYDPNQEPAPENGEAVALEPFVGVLEMHPNGYGFLRDPKNNYNRERTDPFVPGTMIEKFRLREGVLVNGMMQQNRRQQGPRLREIIDVDGMPPEEYSKVKDFDSLTAVNPDEWLRLETGPLPLTTRVMDLLTPLGKGQRALIVSPPRAGKTIMLQHISQAISANYPELKLIVLLVDERPEEVTDMRRNVDGEVVASSLDREVESHVRLSKLVVERCRRLAEMGHDVFLLMDSITRMARAFNKVCGNNRTMSGGVDIKALDVPKKLFATARAFEEGGSLTIVATALIDTGSRMDEVIFQEFKGTGNMELVLDRKLADRRVFPAIDISQSGTRREELLLPPNILHAVTMLRRTLTQMHHVDAMEQLTAKLMKFETNKKFIDLIAAAHVAD